MQTDEVEVGLTALGDATRRRILERLAAAGACAVGDLARGLPVGRPAVSMHLRVLQDAGLVRHERAGNRRLYHLDPHGLALLRAYLDAYWSVALGALEHAASARQKGQAMAIGTELSVLESVVVPLPLVEAFALFIQQDRWWPRATHHLAEPPGETVVLEPFEGGRWFERGADGREQEWGRVLVWRPPHQLVLSWLMSADWTPEPDPARASEIDVRFLAEAPDRTRLEFEHRHLERYGPRAEDMRAVLDGPGGAVGVVIAYAAHAASAHAAAASAVSAASVAAAASAR